MNRQNLIRIVVHLLLAVFLANAANKFFVADLEADEGRYALIFDGIGEAPDQFRILPLLGIEALCEWMPFHTAVLVFNLVMAFACLELFAVLLQGVSEGRKLTFGFLFSSLYVYTLYTGWRPDTLGLLFVCLLVAVISRLVRSQLAWLVLMTVGLAALAFSRSEIAMVYAFVLAMHHGRKWLWGGAWVAMAGGIQMLLSNVIYPDAVYATKAIMLMDNLSGYFLVRNPATWLILAACIIWWKPLSTYVRKTWRDFFYFYLAALAYVMLVLVIGRVNEFRLYLPFLPLFIMMLMSGNYQDGQKTRAV